MIHPALNDIAASVCLRPSTTPSDNCPWCNGMEYHHDSSRLCLHRELIDFAGWIGPTPEEKHLRLLVIRRFRNAITALWPQAMAICHGSTATGTYLPSSDIDLVVQHESGDHTSLLAELHGHLASLALFRRSEVVSQARIPIIKGIENPFGFHIDISINAESGFLNVERVRHLLAAYPALYPLLLFAKLFLFQARLDEPFHGGLGANTLQNMVLFIIQASPAEQRTHLGRLLMAFLKTFGETFNYIVTGISTRGDGRLFSKLDTGRVNWAHPFCFSIEDPQSPGRFLGENAFQALAFRKRCRKAYQRLLFSGHSQSQSLLLRIIKLPYSIIQRRHEINAQYQSLFSNPIESFSLETPESWPSRDCYDPERHRGHSRRHQNNGRMPPGVAPFHRSRSSSRK
jgi:non-canonical poly(A) RNA polymerase PAPD5/7